jgi:hypothetical protein
MQRTLAITTLILAAGVGMALADGDIWRWKDAQGVFHYSDQWVPGSELIKSTRPHTQGDEASPRSLQDKSLGDAVTNADKDIQKQQAARSVAADVAKAREQQCKAARERYDKAVQARRIYKPGKDGEREYVSEDEANAIRQQAKDEVDQACGAAK